VRRLGFLGLSVIVLAVAFVSVCCALAVHNGCFHTPPPVSRPDPGTPRASYCNALIPTQPWVSLTVGPCLLVTLVAWLSRRRLWLTAGFALLICALAIANAVVLNSLTWALTI
jgi:hypothetical protein